MFNCCPLSQTGSPFSLRRRERQAKYNHWFYQKVHSRKKITKITKYQWKPTRVHQQVKRARSRMTASPGCAGGAQQPTYLEALHWSAAGWCTGRAGHWWSWAGQGVTLLSHAESSHWAPAGPSALSALQQKMPPVRHPGATSWQRGWLTPAPTALVSPLSQAHPPERASVGKMELVQKY